MKRLFVLLLLFLFIFNNGYCQSTYPPNDRANHNRINTRKNLLQKYTLDQLSVMISSGNFDDIYVGDYIEMEMTTVISGSNVTEKVRWLVADIDYFYDKTIFPITTHHIVLVAEDCFTTLHRMNNSDTAVGGFANSEMYVTTLPLYDTAITNAFGNNHVLTYSQSLSDSINTNVPSMAGNNYNGGSSSFAWCRIEETSPHMTKLMLMSEIQLYGTKILSSSFYDIGINNSQFAIFRQMPKKIYSNDVFWLSAVSTSVTFAVCYGVDGKSSGLGSSTLHGLRPYFLFY